MGTDEDIDSLFNLDIMQQHTDAPFCYGVLLTGKTFPIKSLKGHPNHSPVIGIILVLFRTESSRTVTVIQQLSMHASHAVDCHCVPMHTSFPAIGQKAVQTRSG